MEKEWDELAQKHGDRLQVNYVLDKAPRGWKGEILIVGLSAEGSRADRYQERPVLSLPLSSPSCSLDKRERASRLSFAVHLLKSNPLPVRKMGRDRVSSREP
jgi:hypothetical protein